MQPDDLVNRLQQVLGLSKSPYRSTGFEIVERRQVPGIDEIEAFLANSTPTHDGWIARQSGVEVWRGGVMHGDKDLGAPLAAELGSDNTTIQIRRLPGKWVLTVLEEKAAGASHLVEDIEHITVHDGTMMYRRYWSLPEDGATEPVAARLVGFGEATSDA